MMDFSFDMSAWDALSYREKNRELYRKQKRMLDTFLEHGAITRLQHDQSLRALAHANGTSSSMG